MTTPDKKYIVVDEKSGQTFRFGADQWATDQHDFMNDFPDATIIEYDSYSPENLKDNDTVFVNTESGTYSFSAEDWKRDEAEFRKDFKKVEPSIARNVDYYYNQALDLEAQIEQKKQSIADWEQRNSAEREKRLQWNPDTPAVPFIEDMQAAHKETEIEAEGNTLYNELDDLERRFYANPRVTEAMEENKRLREEAQRKYVADLETEAESMLAEAGVDVAEEKLRTHETMMSALDGQYGSLFSAKGPSGETKEQVREYNKAGGALTMLQHAKDIREGKADGFFEGMVGVVGKDIKELMYQSESESFVQVALLLKRLNNEIGSLNNLTAEDIDKHLNKEEALLLRSYFELMSAQKEARVNWKDNWKYTAGEIAGESIKFALEFAAIGGLADDAAKGATKGLTLAMEKWINRGLQKGSKALLRKGVAWTADLLLRGGIKSAIVTAMRPSTYATIAQHLPEQDEEGNIRLGRNALIGALDAGIETISEMSGDLISKGLGVVFKPVSKVLGKAKDKALGVATKMFGEAVQNVKFNKWGVFFGGALPDYVKAAGFHGIVPEMLEEVVGNAMRLSYGDESLFDMFKDGNGRAMLLGFIPMTIFGGAASAAQFREVDERAAKLGDKLSSFLASKGYEQGRIEALTERRTDKSPLELDVQMRMLREELEKSGATEEELNIVDEYAFAVAEFQTLRGITEMREKQDLQEENRALTQQYGKVDVNGQVTIAETKDGRRVFLVSERDGNGQYAAVDQQTGKQSFITDADIASIKDAKGNDIAKRRSVPLNIYLGERLNQRNRLKEAERMLKEKNEQIAKINELMPDELNLGTEGEPNMVAVKSKDAKGVTVVNAEGREAQMSWDAVGRVIGLPIRVFTDMELAEMEAQEIALQREALRAARAKKYAENKTVTEELKQIKEDLDETAPRPEEAYTDKQTGKVDEVSFWENDPEGYCKWNDRQNKDGGADSIEQLENSIASLSSQFDAATKASKTDNPMSRKTANREAKRLAERIQRLQAIQDGYLDKFVDQVMGEVKTAEQRADAVIAMRERINEWRERFNLDESKLTVYESLNEVENADARKLIMQGADTPGWTTGNRKRGMHAYIYLPHVKDIASLDKIIMHEVVTHYGLKTLLGEKDYNTLMDKVWNMMSDSARRTMSFYPGVQYKEGEERRRAAAEEFLALVAENVVMDNASAEQKSLWKRVADSIAEKFDQLQVKLNGLDVAGIVKDNYARLEAEGKSEATAEEGKTENTTANAEETLAENGYDVDEQNGDVRFSSRYITNDSQREDIINSIVEVTGRTAEEAERWLQSEESVASLVLADKQYLDYLPDDKYKAIKDNSDYPQGTVDFNNICRKRIPFTKMYTRLQRRYPNRIFTAEELADIRIIMSEDGLTVACGLCYVEDRRQKLGEVADAFISDLKDGFKTYAQANATKQSNAAKFLVLVGSDSYVPTIYDLITLEGSDKLYNEHRGIWEAFGAYNRARGQQTQNTFQGYAEYKREILGWSKAKVNKVNSLGGLRVFSYSDFEAHHLLDLVQIIIDCAAKGVMIQGYTKVPEFARAVANTGIKLNRSLIPLGDTGIVDGKLAYDPVEGIDVNDPNFLESNDNVGNILIGINHEQIRMAMLDPFINYIIPYHARQAGVIRAKLNVGAWTNYIDTQNERDAKTGKRVADNINIYTDILGPDVTNDREFVEKYLQKCAEMGRIPKFDEFLDRDAEGNYVYTPGYYKFLVDFKLFDENGNILPQKPVVAQFDDAFNMQILQEYAEGERQTTGAQMNATYDKIVETLGLNEEEAEGKDVRFKTNASQEAVDSVLGKETTMFKTENIGDAEVTNLVLDSSKMDLPKTRDEAIAAIPKSGKICKAADGAEIRVSRRSVRHSVLHNNKNSYALFGVIDDVVANSVKIGEIPIAEDEIGKTNSVSVYYVPVNINGTQYSARIIVKETIHNEKVLDTLSLYNVALHTEKTPSNTNVGESEETRVYSDSVKSAYKVKEIIHNSQAEDKKLVGIENETTFFKTAPRTDEQRAALFDAAKEEFGVTNNFGVAGYMLPDGTLLDFSEVKDGGPANVRTRDHREIGGIMEDREYDTRTEYITDFLNEGAIRIMPESDAINLSVAPSEEQRKKLLDYFYKKDGYIILELDNPEGKSVAYVEYDKKTSPYRIMRDIDNYFNEGIVPQQNTMFKTSNNNQTIFVSNAAKAVEGINMGKAAPEQWLKTLEKNGGLKAAEDKWIGLSEWLKTTDKKSVTKQELLDFINENMIQIEETHYGEESFDEGTTILDEKYPGYGEAFSFDYDEHFGRSVAFVEDEETAVELYNNSHNDKIEFDEDGDLSAEDYEKLEAFGAELADIANGITTETKQIHDTRRQKTTKGLENRHEIALTVPTIEPWNEGDDIHFGDAGEGRAVAWIRFGETTDENGNRVLVIDEIQSNRHQEGREKGYLTEEKRANADAEHKRLIKAASDATSNLYDFIGTLVAKYPGTEYDIESARGNLGRFTVEERLKFSELEDARRDREYELRRYKAPTGIPEAPFEKNWHELAMKRMLRYAAENGYDYIAWTKGDQQSERYKLGGVVDYIEIEKSPWGKMIGIRLTNGGYIENYVDANGDIVQGTNYGHKLSDVVGKEVAEQIMTTSEPRINGGDLVVANEGMRGFYDKMLPAFMNKYGKKWGMKVSDIALPNLEAAGQVMHSVPVTEEMKESVMEGQTMFKTSPHQSSLEEITDMFYEWNKDDSLRPLFRKAYDFCNEIDLDVKFVSEKEMARIRKQREGEASLGTNWGSKIRLNSDAFANMPDQLKASVILHEMIHAATNYILVQKEEGLEYENHREAKRELQAIFEEIKKKFPYQYGSTDVDEMVAEMADLEFRKVMQEGTWWERFLNAIRRLLGISEKEYDRLTPTLASLYEIMDNPNFELFERAKPKTEEYTRFKTEITPEVREEMDVIAAQAMVNGDYLLAPNGKDTKLTPEQWALVRTKNFKEEYGDWENDPENSLVPLDENGEPTENNGEYSESEDIRFKTKMKSYGIHNKYGQKDDYTQEFLDDIYMRVLSKYHFGKDSSPYVYMDGYIMRLDVPDTEHLKYYRNVDKTDGFGVRFGIFVGDITEEEFNKIVDDYEHRVSQSSETFGGLLSEYREATGRAINSDNVDVEDAGTGVNNDGLYRQTQREAARLGTFVAGGNSYLRASEIDTDISPISRINLLPTSEEDTFFKTRTKPAPTKTQEVYKLMRLGADGRLYPLFIGSADAIELGVWYDADSPNLGDLTKLASGVHLVNNETGEAMTLDQFKAEHPEIAIKGEKPNIAAINWATENGMRWISIEDKVTAQKRYEGESRSYYNFGINGSGQVGLFAMRPGWHAGSLPSMRQIGKGKDKNLRDDSFVWVRGRVPADIDYQSEADTNPDKDIPTHIPTDGFYMKATNANKKASQADKIGWYVAGSFIADEIISDAEARRVIDSWNEKHPDAKVEYDFERESGREFDPARGGLVESDTMFKTSHERALRGLVTLESSNASFEAVQQVVKNRIEQIEQKLARLNKLPDTEVVKNRIASLEDELDIAKQQQAMLDDTASRLIDETLVEPDYASALNDTEPKTPEEAIAQALTMSIDAATRKKVGITLDPASLEKELGWTKDDWKGIGYIVSPNGITLDRLAEMLGENSELESIFSGMDTMEIKNAIINFLQGVGTYAEIRDFIKNERMRQAKEEADEINSEILSKSAELRNGLTVEEYNSWMIEADRKDRRDQLEAAEAMSADPFDVAEQIADSAKGKANAANATLMDRIRKISITVASLRSVMASQKEYDKATVKAITDIASELLTSGMLTNVRKGEIKKLLSIINGGLGKTDLTISANRLIDLMIGNQLHYLDEIVGKFMKARTKKVDSKGVEIRGEVDVVTQKVMKAFKDGMDLKLKDAELEEKIMSATDELSNPSEVIRNNAAYTLAGLKLAKRYREEIVASKAEEKALKDEIKDMEEAQAVGLAFNSEEDFRAWKESTEQAMRENRLERIAALQKFVEDLSLVYTGGIESAKLQQEEEKTRVQQIQHYANSDMEGMPSNEHGKVDSMLWNNSLIRGLLAPLATFDQMLRYFGRKSVNGEGYLWNYFMRSWLKATENEYKGVQAAHEMLDAKAQELFGKEGVKRWSDIFDIDRKLPGATLPWWDGGEMRDHEVTQGNMLYIYMVNKMTDGKMKLRKMGISEEDVARLVDNMDPRFIEVADWIQDIFLPGLRDKYNAVHEAMFGAAMAAIDSYFPIRVLANARQQDVDVAVKSGDVTPSTITGSIIKRTRNNLALDILRSNAFDVVLDHIQKMEHWAAFAGFNRDLNALLSYTKFRNRVKNMKGIYGAGEEVWDNFRKVAEIAAGVYQPAGKKSKIDTFVLNIAKGVTAGKINGRVYTAIKQLLSMPAFISDASAANLAKSLTTPKAAWDWAMQNLPLFEKRWKSRQAGDSRLMETDSDWKIWKSKVVELSSRYGMAPNAFVDAVTVAIGAKAIYDTKKVRYLEMGYSEAKADERAKMDATILFNESQQSNESAFLSAMQVDRTWASVLFTLFRNSSMGYQRMFANSISNLKHRMEKGYKQESIEFMKKQLVRDGLSEQEAEKAAEKMYGRSLFGNAMRAVTFGFIVQFAWNLGAYLPYFIAGDDDDEKEKMLEDAARHAMFGPIEGLAGGSILSDLGNRLLTDEGLKNFDPSLSPLVSDIKNIFKMYENDKVVFAAEMLNLITQMGIGVNPQTITDIGVAIYDACDGDPETSKEVALLIMKILNAPQSQIDKIYLDEIDFTADQGLDLTISEVAERYAKYKRIRKAHVFGTSYDEEKKEEVEGKYIRRFTQMAEEAKRTRGNETAKAYYEYLDNEYKEITETIRDLKQKSEDAKARGNKGEKELYDDLLEALKKTAKGTIYNKVKPYIDRAEAEEEKMKGSYGKRYYQHENRMLKAREDAVNKIISLSAETDAND